MKTGIGSTWGSSAAVALLLLLATANVGAVMLTDEQLYFDPESAEYDSYPRVELPDLTVENSHTWDAEGDPIVDVDILPVLKAGDYPVGYTFSQDDYKQTPNVDYYADLTDGALTATFETSAQYMVRLHRESGATEIHTVFAETGMLERPGREYQTGPSRAISGPEGDVILVADAGAGDAALTRAKANISDEGKTVRPVFSVEDAISD